MVIFGNFLSNQNAKFFLCICHFWGFGFDFFLGWIAVQPLQVLYTSLNSPSQLTNWKSSGGDPCGESWKGITCEGTAVVSMYECLWQMWFFELNLVVQSVWDLVNGSYCCCNSEISGLGLNGTMGYLLSDLKSLRKLWEYYCFIFLIGLWNYIYIFQRIELLLQFYLCLLAIWATTTFMIQSHISCHQILQACKFNLFVDCFYLYEAVIFVILWNISCLLYHAEILQATT